MNKEKEKIIEEVLKQSGKKFSEMLIKDFGEDAKDMDIKDDNFKELLTFAIQKALNIAEENHEKTLKDIQEEIEILHIKLSDETGSWTEYDRKFLQGIRKIFAKHIGGKLDKLDKKICEVEK